jgi:hypothetical protein
MIRKTKICSLVLQLTALSFCVVMLSACGQNFDTTNDEATTAVVQAPPVAYQDDGLGRTILVSNWNLYVTGKTGSETRCNVCPKVEFTIDHKGIITYPTGEKEIVKYYTNDTIIQFENVDGTKLLNNSFFDSEYSMSYSQNEYYSELTLTQKEKQYWYIFRK